MGDGPTEKSSKKSVTKVWPKTTVFRHTNPYLNFLGEFRTAPENKGISVKDVFKAAAQKWKHLTPEDKTPYVNAAKNAKREVKTINSKKKIKLKKLRKTLKERKNTMKLSKLCTTCSKCGHRNKGDKIKEMWNAGYNKTEKKRTGKKKKDSESSVTCSVSQTISFPSDSGDTLFDSDASSLSF